MQEKRNNIFEIIIYATLTIPLAPYSHIIIQININNDNSQSCGFDEGCGRCHLYVTGVQAFDGETPRPDHKLLVPLPSSGRGPRGRPSTMYRVVDSVQDRAPVNSQNINLCKTGDQ